MTPSPSVNNRVSLWFERKSVPSRSPTPSPINYNEVGDGVGEREGTDFLSPETRLSLLDERRHPFALIRGSE